MPLLPGHHAARIAEASAFVRFRTESRDMPRPHTVVVGKPRSGSESDQSLHYPVDEWTQGQARKHAKTAGAIHFEPSKETAIDG